jgi:hypothetical protein
MTLLGLNFLTLVFEMSLGTCKTPSHKKWLERAITRKRRELP